MWQQFFLSIGLVLIIEGILPFINPEKYKQFSKKINKIPLKNLRKMGGILVICGLVIIMLAHKFE